MLQAEEILKVSIDAPGNLLEVEYASTSDRTIYDICDSNGRILQTGKIEHNKFSVDIRSMEEGKYIFLVLDGDRVWTERFTINR